MKTTIILKSAVLATLLLTNPLSAAETVKESVAKTTHSVGETIEESSITTQVKMALLLHRSTSALLTEVSTNKGVVTVSGVAKNSAEKDFVTKLVENVHGVKSVHNKMTIDKAVKQTAGETIDDSSITTKVKMALVLHRSTSALRTTVNTTNGVVTVSGNAKNSAEKELVDKVVEDVDGVKSVVNNMIVE